MDEDYPYREPPRDNQPSTEIFVENSPRNPINQSMTQYPSMDSGLTQWQLDTNEILADIEHKLKGEVYDNNKKDYIRVHKPMLSDAGISDLIFSLRMHFDKSLILSNFDARDVNRMAQECSSTIIDFIFYKHKQYDIDPKNFDLILYAIEHITVSVLKRAYMEGERKFLGRTETRVERSFQEPQKRGFFDRFKIFR